jgi:hypothetical protein
LLSKPLDARLHSMYFNAAPATMTFVFTCRDALIYGSASHEANRGVNRDPDRRHTQIVEVSHYPTPQI